MSNSMQPIPRHLAKFDWYAKHQAWLAAIGAEPRHDPAGAVAERAYLSGANLSGAYLSGADLRGANLSGADLRGANLSGAYLRGANLSGAYLSGANLSGANLCDADLCDAVLSCADLSGAAGLPTAPVVENIDAKILAAIEAGGTLKMSDWHSCETTHCRAGWAIHLAGEDGYALERQTSSYLAGRLIYESSRPGVPCPNFFASNEEAMEDLRKAAGVGG